MIVLIADDEHYARKALSQMVLDWDASVTVVEARNGQEAVRSLEAGPIDLVFTDIRMPLLDGLELSAILFERFPQTINVIISGYDDFKYAQQAIQYYVRKYILKPVEKAELYGILHTAQALLEQKTHKHMTEQLHAVLHEQATAETISLPPVHSFATAVLQSAGPLPLHTLGELVSRTLKEYPFTYCHLEEPRHAHMSIVLIIAGDRQSAESLWVRTGLFSQLQRKVEESDAARGRLTIGVSRIHRHLQALPESYREAKVALLQRLLSKEHVFEYTAGPAKEPSSVNRLQDVLHALYHKMMHKQIEEAKAMIDRSFGLIAEYELPVHHLVDTCYKLVSILNSVIESVHHEAGEPMPYVEPVDLYQFDDIHALIAYFRSAAIRIAEYFERVHPTADMMDDLKAYMESNFSQPLKLEDIARTVYYADPTHISKQFKRKYGVTFSQYLISLRLSHARLLLQSEGSLSIADIAGMCGFNDYSYFIQMYKKRFGETPGKHKKVEREH